MEENFSMDRGQADGFGMIQAHYIQAHLLLCSAVPNRPRPVQVRSLKVGDLCSVCLSKHWTKSEVKKYLMNKFKN